MKLPPKALSQGPTPENPNYHPEEHPEWDLPINNENPTHIPTVDRPWHGLAKGVSVSIWRLGNGTEVGNPGDYAVAIEGNGFWEGEERPKLHLGVGMVLEDVYVLNQGKQLYAILPATDTAKVSKLQFANLAIQNPSGLDRDERRWTRIEITQSQFIDMMHVAKNAKIITVNYQMVMDQLED